MSTKEPETRDIIEQIVGCSLASYGLYRLARSGQSFSYILLNYRKYLKIDLKKRHKIHALIANPQLRELTFLDVFCNANKETFKYHFKAFNQRANKTNTFYSLCPIGNFEASSIEDGQKFQIICTPHYSNCIYMSSTLLKNMKALEKSRTKKPFTALAYGELQYSRSNKSLLFFLECLITSKLEADQIWRFGLSRQTSIKFFMIGLLIGVGSSIVQHHKQYFKAYFEKIKEILNGYLQRKQLK